MKMEEWECPPHCSLEKPPFIKKVTLVSGSTTLLSLQLAPIPAAYCKRESPQCAWCPLTTQYVMTLSTSAGGGKIGSFLLLSYIQ